MFLDKLLSLTALVTFLACGCSEGEENAAKDSQKGPSERTRLDENPDQIDPAPHVNHWSKPDRTGDEWVNEAIKLIGSVYGVNPFSDEKPCTYFLRLCKERLNAKCIQYDPEFYYYPAVLDYLGLLQLAASKQQPDSERVIAGWIDELSRSAPTAPVDFLVANSPMDPMSPGQMVVVTKDSVVLMTSRGLAPFSLEKPLVELKKGEVPKKGDLDEFFEEELNRRSEQSHATKTFVMTIDRSHSVRTLLQVLKRAHDIGFFRVLLVVRSESNRILSYLPIQLTDSPVNAGDWGVTITADKITLVDNKTSISKVYSREELDVLIERLNLANQLTIYTQPDLALSAQEYITLVDALRRKCAVSTCPKLKIAVCLDKKL